MKKISVERKDNHITSLEYDENEYEIEYLCDDEDVFVLKRLSDNEIVNKFKGSDILSIRQVKKDNINKFITIGAINSDMGNYCCIYGYEDDGTKLLKPLDMHYCNKYKQISDDVYYIVRYDNTGYFTDLSKSSKSFSSIYADEVVRSIIGDNTILVSEDRYSEIDETIKDTITYGIDINSYEIKTPIWSELQRRYIPLVTEKECLRKTDELSKKGIYIRFVNDDLGEKTIKLEVDLTLDEIAKRIEHGPSVYTNGVVNKEFVKGFRN